MRGKGQEATCLVVSISGYREDAEARNGLKNKLRSWAQKKDKVRLGMQESHMEGTTHKG